MPSPVKRKPMGFKAYILIAFGGLFLASYVINPTGTRNEVSRAEIEDILLAGAMPQYWHAVKENAPDLFDGTVDSLYQSQRDGASEDDVIAIVNDQMAMIYRSLTGQLVGSLVDIQRREILNAYTHLLDGAKDYPAICSDIIVTGGRNLTNNDMRLIAVPWDQFNSQIVISLTQVEDGEVDITMPPSIAVSQDYEILISEASRHGLTRQGYIALSEGDAGHHDFCDANIAVYTALTLMEGAAGDRLRHDETNLLLIGG